ncbi:hypothetical protein LNTAR_10901 [Lentisphaera araneosa HTCC2155]|uniref:DUF1549 domain-containing protein n=1 Tax=Lentisphaera araneosa HTCC2155 TaxID=313628 RepID=A6DIY3_9BACT|nr:DUF1549 domain-containing protein [Lentisphaera araneosa]EDM28419.1 hypothetical protein LNTAR_10901 [Lentisphaera araneosa HTCC2155]
MKLYLILLFLLPSLIFSATHPNDAIAKINSLVNSKLEGNLNKKSDDSTFVRRIYLDIIGRIPSIEESSSFISNKNSNKRQELIKNLIMSEAYVSNNFNYWADILRITNDGGNNIRVMTAAYSQWLKKSLRDNKRYDDMVFELLSSEGSVWDNPAASYYLRDNGMPLDNTANTIRVFLGTRLECAQCHDHPFDDWTQMEFYQAAAFTYGYKGGTFPSDKNSNLSGLKKHIGALNREKFAQAAGSKKVRVVFNEKQLQDLLKNKNFQKYLKKSNMSQEEYVRRARKGMQATTDMKLIQYSTKETIESLFGKMRSTTLDTKEKDLKLPHDYQYDDAKPESLVKPATMFGDKFTMREGESRREAFARWLTSTDNPTFTRVIANRMWKKAFGVAVFSPVDEINDFTNVRNEELMNYLEQLMKDLDYNLKAFQYIIFNTDAYQAKVSATQIGTKEAYDFRGPVLRRMSAEQLWDSLITLSIENPDIYLSSSKSDEALVSSIRAKYQAIENMDTNEFVDKIMNIAEYTASRDKEIKDLRLKTLEARKEKDFQNIKKHQQATKKIYKSIEEKTKNTLAMSTSGSMDMQMMDSMNYKAKGNKNKFQLIKQEPSANLSKNQLKVRNSQFKQFEKMLTHFYRASELSSPSPRGHFLRDFGQSDRLSIQNANKSPTITQALNLMNGHVYRVLNNPHSLLGRKLHASKSTPESFELLYQAFFSRKPTTREWEILGKETKISKSEATKNVLWALLNSKQFTFIQ